MRDVKYNSEQLQKESQEFIDKFKAKIKSITDEVLGEAYVNIMPYMETDTWTNYREALRIELEHEYKFSKFKDDWATNFRRAVFVENREEIAKLISDDILKRIKHLEDCRQEYEMFRYTPLGDTYQDKVKENETLRADNQRLRDSFSILKAKVSDLQNHYHTDIFSDYDLKTNPKPSIDQVAAKMGRHLCGVFLLQIDEALSESEASNKTKGEV